MKICSIENCDQKHVGKGFCNLHYIRYKKHGDPLVRKNERHGKSKTPEYRTWRLIRARCYDPEKMQYKNYGGRGITVCKRWKNSFIAFYEDMGPKPFPMAQIDRINNNGNYEPSNCRWTTAKINMRNSSVAKLNIEIATLIRKAYVPYIITQRMLGDKYGVDCSTVHYILCRKTWI